MECISGKRVMLFGIKYEADLAYADKLLTPDYKAVVVGYPPPIIPDSVGWIIQTMQGKASQKVGGIFITPISEIGVVCQVIIEPKYAVGLDEMLEKKKQTYIGESVSLVSAAVLSNGGYVYRIEIGMHPKDKLARLLFGMSGFEEEGILRNSCVKNGQVNDLLIMAKIKNINQKEAENGKKTQKNQTEGLSEIKETEAGRAEPVVSSESVEGGSNIGG